MGVIYFMIPGILKNISLIYLFKEDMFSGSIAGCLKGGLECGDGERQRGWELTPGSCVYSILRQSLK